MNIVNIHEAKTHLSRLIEQAVLGEAFIIAKAGRPLVKVSAINTPTHEGKRLGFMMGHLSVPEDFDSMGAADINQLFGGEQ